MRITEAIARARALYPNHYTDDEMLGWASELTALIEGKIRRRYGTFVTQGGEGMVLPPSVLPEDIVAVKVNGQPYRKEHLVRAMACDGVIEATYRVRTPPYEQLEIAAADLVANMDENKITLPLWVEDDRFRAGDRVSFVIGGIDNWQYVMEVGEHSLMFADLSDVDLSHTEKLVREITEETPAPAPYDAMYVEYLMGKVAYYSNDLEGYNKHTSMCNALIEDYEKWYKQTAPIVPSGFVNKW